MKRKKLKTLIKMMRASLEENNSFRLKRAIKVADSIGVKLPKRITGSIKE